MDSSNKRQVDFERGKTRREITATDLNWYLNKHDTGLHFERRQPYLKTMNIAEKAKNNELKNYIIPSPFINAMALHYDLVKTPTHKIPFIFCYRDAQQFYLKLPKEYKTAPESYLCLLEELNYHTIIVDETTKRYSHIISFKDIREHWRRRLSTTKGNTNRYQFSGGLGEINYISPEKATMLTPSLIDSLNNLFS